MSGSADRGIGELMKNMAAKTGLIAATGKKITNHSGRKTCVQKLRSAGVPRDEIIHVTEHRNVNSLNSYERDYENYTKKLSNIISGSNTPETEHDKKRPDKKSKPLRDCSSNSNYSTVNNFSGTVNFYGVGGFPVNFPGPSGMRTTSTANQDEEPKEKRAWKRITALSDSDED